MAGISQGYSNTPFRARSGRVGALVFSDPTDEVLTFLNSDPQAKAVKVCTVSAATNDKVYTFTINSVDVSYTADASATIAEIAAGLHAAVDLEPAVRGSVVLTSDATTCTLTAVYPGVDFTFTEADAELSIATSTAAASADAIPFAVGVADNGVDAGGSRLCRLVQTSAFSAQVATIAVTYVAGASHIVTVARPATLDSWSTLVVSDTDDDTTATAIRAAVNAMLPASTMIATGATDEVILTAEILGDEFEVTVSADTLALVQTTGPSTATSVARAIRGLSRDSADDPAPTIAATASEYAGNDGVKVIRRGSVWVESTQTIAYDDQVYIELGATDTGKFFNTSGATRVALPRDRWEWQADGLVASENLAILRLK